MSFTVCVSDTDADATYCSCMLPCVSYNVITPNIKTTVVQILSLPPPHPLLLVYVFLNIPKRSLEIKDKRLIDVVNLM